MLSSTDQTTPVQPAPTIKDEWNRRLVFLRIVLITGDTRRHPVLAFQPDDRGAAHLARCCATCLCNRARDRSLASLYASRPCNAAGVSGRHRGVWVSRLYHSQDPDPPTECLAQSVQTFVTPGNNGQESPLDQTLQSLGFYPEPDKFRFKASSIPVEFDRLLLSPKAPSSSSAA